MMEIIANSHKDHFAALKFKINLIKIIIFLKCPKLVSTWLVYKRTQSKCPKLDLTWLDSSLDGFETTFK